MTTEPTRGRGRARIVGRATLLGLLVLVTPFVSPTVRTGVETTWLVRQMRSEDEIVRLGARERLLEIGRPAVDRWLPEIITDVVADAFEEERQDDARLFAVLIGKPHGRYLDYDNYRIEDDPPHVVDRSEQIPVPFDLLVEGACRRLFPSPEGHDQTERTMLIGSWDFISPRRPGQKRTALAEIDFLVPLDDQLGPAIVAAVKDYLGKLPKWRGPQDCGPGKGKKKT